MIRQELLDYELHLDGKHIADFEHLNDAKAFGFIRVDCKYAERAMVINKWTGEVVYEAYATRKVVEE